MNKSIKNTTFSLLSIICSSVLAFVMRSFLIKYLGVELLGVNATVAETINFLSAAELGTKSAISYKMYKPINDNDLNRQRELFGLYRVAYWAIGLAVIIIGLCILPFLHRIVNTQISMNIVYAAYLLQLLITASTYFLGYYKILFDTYQNMHVYIPIQTLLDLLTKSVQIVVLFVCKNYLLYLACSTILVIGMFGFTKVRAHKDYDEIVKPVIPKREDVLLLLKDLKQMIGSTIAAYVYGSTDNMLLSVFFGSLVTGYISNYKTITNLIRGLIQTIYTGTLASWGAFLHKDTSEENISLYFYRMIFLEFAICLILLLPTAILIDDFIILWLGTDFLIEKAVVYLMIFDLFFTFLHQPTCLIINNLGLFREEKIISIIAAVMNLVTSIVGAKLFGSKGIFIGTIIAVFTYWIGRSWVIDEKCFSNIKGSYMKYWKYNLICIGSFLVLLYAGNGVMDYILISNKYISFITKGILIEIMGLLYIIIVWHNSDEFNFYRYYVLEKLNLSKKGQ